MILPPKPFYFIRHGETDWNKDKILMGQQDIPLNESGIMQAEAAQKLIHPIKFGTIYASPLSRAYKTASIINSKNNHHLISVDALSERGFGESEGKAGDDILAAFLSQGPLAEMPPGAETYIYFKARILSALFNILNADSEALPPLIVAHGGVFAAITHNLGFLDLRASNCSLYFFAPSVADSNCWVITELKSDGNFSPLHGR